MVRADKKNIENDADAEARITEYAREYGASLERYFLRKGVQRATAEDLVQEVFVRLLARERKEKITNSRGYIMQTANSVMTDHWRRRNVRLDRQNPAEYEDHEHSPESLGPERVLVGRQNLKLALETLQEMPERTRQIYLLFHVDGMRRKELAARMGISTSAVDKHLATAKTRLGQVFGKRK